MKDYISEISSPSISPDNLSGVEVQSYLRFLESARQSFIGGVAQYPKNVVKAYLNELMDAKNVIIKRGYIGNEQPALEMVQADIKEAELIYIFSILDKGLMQSLEKTASFLQQVIGEEQPTEPQPQPQNEKNKTTDKEKKATKKEEQPSVFYKTLSEYGAILKVKDLKKIFRCDRKTIYNWEKAGFLVNVAETSEEINSVGRKKRKYEKKYRKEDILKSLELQAKFNERR